MEILIRWRCPCLQPPHHCPYCHGKEYLELWVPHDLVQHLVGGTDFLIQGRRATQGQLSLSAPVAVAAPAQRRATVAGSTLFVRGLPQSFTILNLEEMFAPFGSVLWGRIVDLDSGYSGWGYVDMATPEQAEAALKVLDGSNIEDKRLVVMVSIHAPYALQADRFLHLNLGKAFCELCIRSHTRSSNVFRKELFDALNHLYGCQYFVGLCFKCRKTTQVFAASLES